MNETFLFALVGGPRPSDDPGTGGLWRHRYRFVIDRRPHLPVYCSKKLGMRTLVLAEAQDDSYRYSCDD
jgi:hypothetical protein